MGDAIITRRGSEYTTIKFNGTQAITKVQNGNRNLFMTGAADLQATNIENYAIFAGGYDGTNILNYVYLLSSNALYTLEIAHLYTPRTNFAAANTNNSITAYFAGGETNGNVSTNSVETYTDNLSHMTTQNLYYVAMDLAGVSFNNSAIFAGGYDKAQNNRNCKVNVFPANSSRIMATDLTYYPSSHAGSCNANYAIFAGGWTAEANTQVDTVNAYNSNLTRSTPTVLSVPRERMGTGTAGNYALFVGGVGGNGTTNVVDAYDLNLVRTNPSSYGQPKQDISGTSLGSYAIFAGGRNGTSYYNGVYSYSSTLVLSYVGSTPNYLSNGAATSTDGYAYFAGGRFGSAYHEFIDTYNIPNKVQLYPGTKYKLGSMANEETSNAMQTITTEAPISGYIKIKNTTIS